MTKFIDFYFDFISPYSYLAHKRIIQLNKRNKFNYKPILLGGLHKLGGITAPAFNELKMKNMKNDCSLIAQKSNIQFKWNEKFPLNSLNLMRGYLFIDERFKNKFFDICFDSYWKDNVDITQDFNVKNNYTYLIGGQGGDITPFTQFQIKIVFRSINQALVPRISDLRVIALSS